MGIRSGNTSSGHTVGTSLAEVADERLHLAAIVLDQRDDSLDSRGLGLLAAVEALRQAVAQLVERRRLLEQREALSRIGDLQLDEALLLEVTERRDHPFAFLAERTRVVGIERPSRFAPALPLATHASEEVGAVGSKLA